MCRTLAPSTRWRLSIVSSIPANSTSAPSAYIFIRVPLIPASSTPPNRGPAAKSNCTTPPSTESPSTHESRDADPPAAILPLRGAYSWGCCMPENKAANRRNTAHGSRRPIAGGDKSDHLAQDFYGKKIGDFFFRYSFPCRQAPSARDLRVFYQRSSPRLGR